VLIIVIREISTKESLFLKEGTINSVWIWKKKSVVHIDSLITQNKMLKTWNTNEYAFIKTIIILICSLFYGALSTLELKRWE
jgi:hypothetical protein